LSNVVHNLKRQQQLITVWKTSHWLRIILIRNNTRPNIVFNYSFFSCFMYTHKHTHTYTYIDSCLYIATLGSFLWLNAMGYYIWRTFKSRNVFLRITDGRKYCYYSFYVWGCMLIMGGLAIFAHLILDTRGNFNRNYSLHRSAISTDGAIGECEPTPTNVSPYTYLYIYMEGRHFIFKKKKYASNYSPENILLYTHARQTPIVVKMFYKFVETLKKRWHIYSLRSLGNWNKIPVWHAIVFSFSKTITQLRSSHNHLFLCFSSKRQSRVLAVCTIASVFTWWIRTRSDLVSNIATLEHTERRRRIIVTLLSWARYINSRPKHFHLHSTHYFIHVWLVQGRFDFQTFFGIFHSGFYRRKFSDGLVYNSFQYHTTAACQNGTLRPTPHRFLILCARREPAVQYATCETSTFLSVARVLVLSLHKSCTKW